MSLNSNLQIEQCLKDCKFTEDALRIYATGAYLIPMKISIKGIDHFIWVADDFNDDVFDTKGNNISVKVIADTVENLYI
jgi:hypothetical protein